MARAVHRLQSMLFTCLLMHEKDIFFVLEVVATDFPELRIVDIRRNNFTVSSDLIFGSHKFNQTIVNDGTVREE
jgi:hypothetical protein